MLLFRPLSGHKLLLRLLTMSAFDRINFPPRQVRGMVELDRDKFRKSIEIPCVQVPTKSINRVINLDCVRQLQLERSHHFKAIRDCASPDAKLLLLDPDKFRAKSTEDREQVLAVLAKHIDIPPQFDKMVLEMEYADWDWKRCVRAVLPEELELSSFEQCGHIIHLNLREKLNPYRFVIGQILLDKTARARTVVNKLDMLTNEFRVMDMELLAGEPNYLTEVSEQGIRYKLDYSKVFWNSRLTTVHENTVQQFDRNSIVFDAFSGVGPFVLPALKKRGVRAAFANDLNPTAIEFLRENAKLNKVLPTYRLHTFVMDAAEFIRRVIPEKVVEFCSQVRQEAEEDGLAPSTPNFHAVMNLPGHSADFLPHFRSMLANYAHIRDVFEKCSFWVHCHFFVWAPDDLGLDWYFGEARRIVHATMGLSHVEIKELVHSRSVSSRKEMFCARIRLPTDFVFDDKGPELEEEQTGTKRQLEVTNADPIVAKERRIV